MGPFVEVLVVARRVVARMVVARMVVARRVVARMVVARRVPADRRCDTCRTRDTPCWRRGPQDGTWLCNPCGVKLRYSHAARMKRAAAVPKDVDRQDDPHIFNWRCRARKQKHPRPSPPS